MIKNIFLKHFKAYKQSHDIFYKQTSLSIKGWKHWKEDQEICKIIQFSTFDLGKK